MNRGEKSFTLHCVGCGKPPADPLAAFCDCGHFIDVRYDLEKAVLHDSPDPCERYFDLLPLDRPEQLLGPSHGSTPCHHARALGARLGMPNLHFKDETVLPTRTTKDRMGKLVVSVFHAAGVQAFSASSTGNSSTALAHWVRHAPGCQLTLFVGEHFLPFLQVDDANAQVQVYALRGATFVEAANEAGAFAARNGLVADRGFFNFARREGLKTAFLEAAEQLPQGIHWYVQAVSSAMGVYGCYKGARELAGMGRIEKPPRLLCVQQESNAPLVRAFEGGHEAMLPEHVVADPRGIAHSILRGDPRRVYPYVRRMVLDSGGTMNVVSEAEIREARTMVFELEGIDCCFTASAAVAGLVKQVRAGAFPVQDTVLVNLTGRDREPAPVQRLQWLERTAEGWRPEPVAAAGTGA